MVGNTGTLMTMRIVRSKLRKREESSTTAATTVTIEAPQHGHHNRSNRSSDSNHYRENQDQQIFTTTTISDGNDNNNSINNCMELEAITFARTSGNCNTSNAWVFPPKAPSPNIYNCANHDGMVVSSERNGFKGFKKQFSGRFKRLVSNKKDATSPIPPELKPQLKTIYVY